MNVLLEIGLNGLTVRTEGLLLPLTQLTFTCSQSIMGTLEKAVKYVLS